MIDPNTWEEWPALAYYGDGPHQRKGGGFDTLEVPNLDELLPLIEKGWRLSLSEAIEFYDGLPANVSVSTPDEIIAVISDQVDSKADVEMQKIEAHTDERVDLQEEARSLGIKVKKNMTNEQIRALIDASGGG